MSQIKYNLQFLKEKGFFRSPIRRILENREVVLDKENGFVYVEVNSNEEVEKFKRLVREEFKRIRYIWFWFPSDNKLKVFRTLGEIKWFWFSPNRERYETRKSKEEKLRKFSKHNISILFDTRDVVNRFYNELWKIRIEMAKTVKDLKEDGNKLYVVQRFIDRMIFFYFLSQLGLVKIKNEGIDWKLNKENTKRFFNWLVETLRTDERLLEFMNEIFFDVLNKVTIEGWSSKKFKIGGETFLVEAPSLNGGLFREEKFEEKSEREIRFKGIRKLIELLNRYNWIVGEEIPEEDRIGDLTPEIIGHIYEKFVVSLEQMGTNLKKIKLSEMEATREGLKLGRKKIGAYYTPEEITNYISKNTIFPYIKDKLREKFGEEAVRFFNEIFKKEIKLEEKHKEILKYLYFEILSKIKICDNACGSGSFLIAAGDILLRIYSRVLYLLEKNFAGDKEVKQIINEIRSSPSRSYYIVRKIITTNLYGVDIMEGAIEIAKLRFWLWLISQLDPKKIEDKKIETLPNLDFNLMVGNSLIGFVDIEDVVKGFTIFDFSKRPLEWLKNLAKEKQRFKTLPAYEAIKLKEKLNKELEKAREFLNEKFYNMLKAKGIKISKEEFLDLKPFHWGFEFYEVFDLEKPKEERGFDVIIGNPPYIRIQEMRKSYPKEVEIYNALYSFPLKNYDISLLFFERSISTLSKSGYFSYISTNRWIKGDFGVKLRNYLHENKYLKVLIDFGYNEVFHGISPYVAITIINKVESEYFRYIFVPKTNSIEIFKEIPPTLIKFDELDREDWILLCGKEKRIFNYLRNTFTRLGEISEIFVGLQTSADDIYLLRFIDFEGNNIRVFSKALQNEVLLEKDLLMPIITGEEVGRYYLVKKDYVLFPYKIKGEKVNILQPGELRKFPLIWNYLKKNRRALENREKGKLKGSKTWYAYLYPKSLSKQNKPKIICQVLSLNPSFALDEQGQFALHNVSVYGIISMAICLKYLLILLNSKMMDWFIRKVSIQFRGGYWQYLKKYLEKYPVPHIKSQKPFIILADYMLFLNATEERRTKEKEFIEFFDRQIINSLVYELYLKEKFYEDNFYERNEYILLKLIESHLKPINYDRWSELHWKKQLGDKLSEKEEKELKELEEENLKIIKEVVEKIRNNKSVIELIQKIKSHEWVKIIEGKKY